MYLLGTNVWVALLRKKPLSVSVRFIKVDTADMRICPIVVAELLLGTTKSAKPASNRLALEAFIQPYGSLPFDQHAAERYAAIQSHLESSGRASSPFDALIAAIALANDCTLVTHNIGEFSRVPGLAVEDWQTP